MQPRSNHVKVAHSAGSSDRSSSSIFNAIVARCKQIEVVETDHAAPDEPDTHGNLLEAAAAVSSQVSVLNVELQDKRIILDKLNDLLASTRQQLQQDQAATSSRWQSEMDTAKREHATDQRSREQEIETLTRKNTRLHDEMHMAEMKYERQTKVLKEDAAREQARQRQCILAAEKAKREEWERQKIKDIKEMTVKGMEPELERILAQRGHERRQLQESHDSTLQKQRTELLNHAQQQAQEESRRVRQEEATQMQRLSDDYKMKMSSQRDIFSEEMSELHETYRQEMLEERRKLESFFDQRMQNLKGEHSDAIIMRSCKTEMEVSEAQARERRLEEQHKILLSQAQERAKTELEEVQRRQEELSRTSRAKWQSEVYEEWHAQEQCKLKLMSESLTAEHTARSAALAAAGREALAKVEFEEQKAMQHAEVKVSETESAMAALRRDRSEQATLTEHLSAREAKLQTSEVEWRAEALMQRSAFEQEQRASKAAQQRQLENLTEEVKQLDTCLDEERHRRAQQSRSSKQSEEAAIEAVMQQKAEALSEAERERKKGMDLKEKTIGELRIRCAAAENKARDLERLLQRQRDELLSGMQRGMA